MTMQQIDKINKSIIVVSIFSSIIFTMFMGWMTGGTGTISWQIYCFSYGRPEVPLIIGLMIGRWVTLIETGRYDL